MCAGSRPFTVLLTVLDEFEHGGYGCEWEGGFCLSCVWL